MDQIASSVGPLICQTQCCDVFLRKVFLKCSFKKRKEKCVFLFLVIITVVNVQLRLLIFCFLEMNLDVFKEHFLMRKRVIFKEAKVQSYGNIHQGKSGSYLNPNHSNTNKTRTYTHPRWKDVSLFQPTESGFLCLVPPFHHSLSP